LPRTSMRSLSLSFSHQNSVCTFPLPHTCHVPVHHILLDWITRAILREGYKPWSCSLWCTIVTITKSNLCLILLMVPCFHSLTKKDFEIQGLGFGKKKGYVKLYNQQGTI
jgi:hypothetical protein